MTIVVKNNDMCALCWSEHRSERWNGQLGVPVQCDAFGHK